jgi:hypothetical protein
VAERDANGVLQEVHRLTGAQQTVEKDTESYEYKYHGKGAAPDHPGKVVPPAGKEGVVTSPKEKSDFHPVAGEQRFTEHPVVVETATAGGKEPNIDLETIKPEDVLSKSSIDEHLINAVVRSRIPKEPLSAEQIDHLKDDGWTIDHINDINGDNQDEIVAIKANPDNSDQYLMDINGDGKVDFVIEPIDTNNDGILDQAKVAQVFVGDKPIDVSTEQGLETLATQVGADYIKIREGIRYLGGGGEGVIETSGKTIEIQADQVAKVSVPGSDNSHTEGMLFLKRRDDGVINGVFVFDQDKDGLPESFIVKGVDSKNSVESAVKILNNQVAKNQFNPKIGFKGNVEGLAMLNSHLKEADVLAQPEMVASTAANQKTQTEATAKDQTKADQLKEDLAKYTSEQRQLITDHTSLAALEQELPAIEDVDNLSFDGDDIPAFLRGMIVKFDQEGEQGKQFLADVLKAAFPQDQNIQKDPLSAALTFKQEVIPYYLDNYDKGVFGPGNKEAIIKLLKSAQEILKDSNSLATK